MFGYLTMKNVSRKGKFFGIYKFYYCGTCKALRYNYGLFAASVLSFDLTIVPAVLQTAPQLKKADKYCDILRKKPDKALFTGEEWKKIAAFNLAITDAHVKDALADERGIRRLVYKLIGLVLHRSIKKAKRDFPALFAATDKGMDELIDVEKTDCAYDRQSVFFGNMCVNALRAIADVDEDQCGFITAVCDWLCLIDAFDDYKKDEKRKKYNPLAAEFKCGYSDLIKYHFTEICDKYAAIKRRLDETCARIEEKYKNGYLNMYAYKIIPLQTIAVFEKVNESV